MIDMPPYTEYRPGLFVRGFSTLPLNLSDYKVIAFDMDSTLVAMETVDEIAAAVGKKAEVAAITEAAMRGEITDFKESLIRRVALLAGTPFEAVEHLRDHMPLNPGAERMVRTARAAGLKTIVVSGGFTIFTDELQRQLGFDYTRSNVLEVDGGRLTGRLVSQPWGDICDGVEKRRMVEAVCEVHGYSPKQAITMGDGSNDLLMMSVAGLPVAYHAKPKVRDAALVAIDEGGLDSLLEIMHVD